MEQKVDIQAIFKENLEPIIDECITRAMNKYINELRFDEPINNNVLGIKEVAEYLKISKSTVYKFTMEHQIPHYKVGRKAYFRKEEIDQWINKGKVKTREELSAEQDARLAQKYRKY